MTSLQEHYQTANGDIVSVGFFVVAIIGSSGISTGAGAVDIDRILIDWCVKFLLMSLSSTIGGKGIGGATNWHR